MIPRSGNNLVDAYDDEQDREDKESRLMECGCLCGNCTCDSAWDSRD